MLQQFIKDLPNKYPNGVQFELETNGKKKVLNLIGQDLANFVISFSNGDIKKAESLFTNSQEVKEKPSKPEKEEVKKEEISNDIQ